MASANQCIVCSMLAHRHCFLTLRPKRPYQYTYSTLDITVRLATVLPCCLCSQTSRLAAVPTVINSSASSISSLCTSPRSHAAALLGWYQLRSMLDRHMVDRRRETKHYITNTSLEIHDNPCLDLSHSAQWLTSSTSEDDYDCESTSCS